MSNVFVGVFVPVLLGGLIFGWVGRGAWDQWRAGTPVPYVPTSEGLDAIARAVTCPWCRDDPHGRCTCGVACRHWRCVRFTRADLDILDGKKAL